VGGILYFKNSIEEATRSQKELTEEMIHTDEILMESSRKYHEYTFGGEAGRHAEDRQKTRDKQIRELEKKNLELEGRTEEEGHPFISYMSGADQAIFNNRKKEIEKLMADKEKMKEADRLITLEGEKEVNLKAELLSLEMRTAEAKKHSPEYIKKENEMLAQQVEQRVALVEELSRHAEAGELTEEAANKANEAIKQQKSALEEQFNYAQAHSKIGFKGGEDFWKSFQTQLSSKASPGEEMIVRAVDRVEAAILKSKTKPTAVYAKG
jgi:hypothetical protein